MASCAGCRRREMGAKPVALDKGRLKRWSGHGLISGSPLRGVEREQVEFCCALTCAPLSPIYEARSRISRT